MWPRILEQDLVNGYALVVSHHHHSWSCGCLELHFSCGEPPLVNRWGVGVVWWWSWFGEPVGGLHWVVFAGGFFFFFFLVLVSWHETAWWKQQGG